MEVVHTTGDRALDEEINRILARLKVVEGQMPAAQTSTVGQVSSTGQGPEGPPGPPGPPGSGTGQILLLTIGAEDGEPGPPGPPGMFNLGASGVTPGAYTSTDLTVNAQGLVTAAASGGSSSLYPVWQTTSKNANYQALSSDCVIYYDTSGGNRTLTLGSLAGDAIPQGKVYCIVNATGANNVTVQGNVEGGPGVYTIATLTPGKGIITVHDAVYGHLVFGNT